MTENETLDAIAATYPTLDRWRTLLAEGVVITHGSELQRQDEEWTYVPSSTVALLGLGAAREHLHAIRLLIDTNELFPSATATLGRAALVGAAQSVWMLAPDDHAERMRRSASLVREDYRHHLNYGKFTLEETETVVITASADGQVERLSERIEGIAALADRYGGASRINMTDEVLPASVEATTTNKDFREHVQLRWRQMSGSAHSLLWPHYGHAGTQTHSVDDDGVGRTIIGGDVERLSMDYFSAFHVASCGWRLFAERAGRPDLAP